MGRTYIQTVNIIRTLYRNGTILGNVSIGNYSCYSTRFYSYGLYPLSRSNSSSRSRIEMSQNILSESKSRFQSTEVKEAKEGVVSSAKQTPDPIIIVTEHLSRKDKLKKAVKEYGSAVIVFHVGISLISLGTSYALVSMGLDVTSLFESMGLKDWIANSNIATNAGTFAVAYAIHKVFAPVRITITLAAVPFIVRYLRKIGFLKK